MILVTTALRSVENLIAAFPNLGRTGAEAEAKAALAEAGTRYLFLGDSFGDSPRRRIVKNLAAMLEMHLPIPLPLVSETEALIVLAVPTLL